MNNETQQQLKVFHLLMAKTEVEDAMAKGIYMNYTVELLREYHEEQIAMESRNRDSVQPPDKVISSTTTKGTNNMTMEELLNQLVNAMSDKVMNQVVDALEDRINDILHEYDFTDNSSFSDSISDTIRNEVEDLLSGAHISL